MTDLTVRQPGSGPTSDSRMDDGKPARRHGASLAQHASFKDYIRLAIPGGADRVPYGAQDRLAGQMARPAEVDADQQEGQSCKALRARDSKVDAEPTGSETNLQLLEASALPWSDLREKSGMGESQFPCQLAQSQLAGRTAQGFRSDSITQATNDADVTNDRAKCETLTGASSDEKAAKALGSRQFDSGELRRAAAKAELRTSGVQVTLLRQEAHFLPVRETLENAAATKLASSSASSHGEDTLQSIATREPKTAQAAQPNSGSFERSMNMKKDDAQNSSLDRKEEQRSDSTLLETDIPGLHGDGAALVQSPNIRTPTAQPVIAPEGGARWRQDSRQHTPSVLRVLDVQLAPTGLGLIGARLSLAEGGLAVRLSAETRNAVDAIESQATSLRGALVDSGYLVADVSVSLETPTSAGDAARMAEGNSAASLNDPGNGSDKGSRPHRRLSSVENTKAGADDHVPGRRDGTYV